MGDGGHTPAWRRCEKGSKEGYKREEGGDVGGRGQGKGWGRRRRQRAPAVAGVSASSAMWVPALSIKEPEVRVLSTSKTRGFSTLDVTKQVQRSWVLKWETNTVFTGTIYYLMYRVKARSQKFPGLTTNVSADIGGTHWVGGARRGGSAPGAPRFSSCTVPTHPPLLPIPRPSPPGPGGPPSRRLAR